MDRRRSCSLRHGACSGLVGGSAVVLRTRPASGESRYGHPVESWHLPDGRGYFSHERQRRKAKRNTGPFPFVSLKGQDDDEKPKQRQRQKRAKASGMGSDMLRSGHSAGRGERFALAHECPTSQNRDMGHPVESWHLPDGRGYFPDKRQRQKAKRNTGVLRFAQDDDENKTKAKAKASKGFLDGCDMHPDGHRAVGGWRVVAG
jgi:hypothetical protein